MRGGDANARSAAVGSRNEMAGCDVCSVPVAVPYRVSGAGVGLRGLCLSLRLGGGGDTQAFRGDGKMATVFDCKFFVGYSV